MEKRYWKITVIRGHCGGVRNYNHSLTFYFEASSLLEASDKARQQPGVKHTLMPQSACEISYEEYCEGRQESAYYRNGMSLVSRKTERKYR